ncbi:HAD family hydrolase [Phocaeicola sp.]
MKQIKNIVFDFGGVIVDIDRDTAVKKFIEIGVKDADSLLDKYHQKDIFLEVEDGRIDAEEFRQKLSALCGKDLTYKEVESGWKSFILAVEQYKPDYLAELRARGYKVFILSNTNPYIMGWARSTEFTSAGRPLDDYVDKIYASYLVKCVKPNRGIFDYMIEDTGINPDETLFVDDGASNIEIGKELGFVTLQPKNGEDWRSKIEKLL